MTTTNSPAQLSIVAHEAAGLARTLDAFITNFAFPTDPATNAPAFTPETETDTSNALVAARNALDMIAGSCLRMNGTAGTTSAVATYSRGGTYQPNNITTPGGTNTGRVSDQR